MYGIRTAKSFRKSLTKRLCSGQEKNLKREIEVILDVIARREPLPKKYNDHALKGIYKGYRECHLKPDLLLIYQVDMKEGIVYAVNVGSHPELFS